MRLNVNNLVNILPRFVGLLFPQIPRRPRDVQLFLSSIGISPFSICSMSWKKVTLIKSLHALNTYPWTTQYLDRKASGHKNKVKWNCRLTCLWIKMSTFQTVFLQCKSTSKPMPTCMVNTMCESFQMRYWMTFYLNGASELP